MKIMAHEMPGNRCQPAPARQRPSTVDMLWRIELVREAMSASGLCQKGLADRIGIHKAHLSRWLHGVRPVPDKWVPIIINVLEGVEDESKC